MQTGVKIVDFSADYRLDGAVKLVTGVVSAGTALSLALIMPQALQLRSPRELQREVDQVAHILLGLVALPEFRHDPAGILARAFADAKNPTYDDDIVPIVKQSCVNCHGNDKQKGDLNVATYAALQKGGAGGAGVVDVALTVRGRPRSAVAPHEDGVRCALERGRLSCTRCWCGESTARATRC